MWQILHMPWRWRGDVLAVLGLLAILYVRGWIRLRRTGYRRAAPWRWLLSYLLGTTATGIALLSPLAVFQGFLLAAHMVQHELLMIAGAPLMLLGRPLAIVLWGIPAGPRRRVGRWLCRDMPPRRIFDVLTQPVIAWGVSTGLLWVWHVPPVYDAVETSRLLHDAQHVSFYVLGLVFWWPVIQAPPFAHRVTLPLLVAYLVAGLSQRALLGGTIALANHVLYPYYSAVHRISPLSSLEDQHLAGGIMWLFSGIVLLVATIVAIWRARERSDAVPGSQQPTGDLRETRGYWDGSKALFPGPKT